MIKEVTTIAVTAAATVTGGNPDSEILFCMCVTSASCHHKRTMGDRRQPRTSQCEISSIPPENLLFAVPKKGRLYDKCMKMLEGVGLEHRRPERLDFANCINMPVRSKVQRQTSTKARK